MIAQFPSLAFSQSYPNSPIKLICAYPAGGPNDLSARVIGGKVAKTLAELISLAKKNPGKLSYASSGVGNPPHLASELLKTIVGIDILHVPYKGVGQSISALVGGEIDMMFTSIPVALPHIKSGRLVAIGVSTSTRSTLLPDVPTLSESGAKGFEIDTWFGWFAPSGTPKDIINRLNAALTKVSQMPDVRERMAARGMELTSSTPEAFAAFVKQEKLKFSRIIKAANIQPQ